MSQKEISEIVKNYCTAITLIVGLIVSCNKGVKVLDKKKVEIEARTTLITTQVRQSDIRYYDKLASEIETLRSKFQVEMSKQAKIQNDALKDNLRLKIKEKEKAQLDILIKLKENYPVMLEK